MGLGHLIDARRLTKNLGGNPDNWLDVKKKPAFITQKNVIIPNSNTAMLEAMKRINM